MLLHHGYIEIVLSQNIDRGCICNGYLSSVTTNWMVFLCCKAAQRAKIRTANKSCKGVTVISVSAQLLAERSHIMVTLTKFCRKNMNNSARHWTCLGSLSSVTINWMVFNCCNAVQGAKIGMPDILFR